MVIDWIGRRKLLRLGSIGSITSFATMSIAFLKYGPYFQKAQSGPVNAAAVGLEDEILIGITSSLPPTAWDKAQ